MRLNRLVGCVCLSSLMTLAACSGGDSDDTKKQRPEPNPTPVEAPAARALALNSAAGCAIDDDCAEGLFCFQQTCSRVCASDADCAEGTCSDRGRCESGGAEALVAHRLPGLRVVSHPDTVRVVQPGEDAVIFEFGLDRPMPPEGIAFRIERSDALGDPEQVRFATGGGNTFRVTVETGVAQPSRQAGAAPVVLKLFSAVGDFDLMLEPAPAYEGTWEGQISIDSFGGAQHLDLTAYILGDSPDSLSMVLPVGAANLFSPRDDHDAERDYERVALEHRAQLGVYQAVFTHEYRFDDGIFGELRPRQVERTLRFDFDAAALRAGRLEGRVTDMWRGLYDGQRSSGALEVGTVRYDGDFVLEHAGELLRPATNFVAKTATPAQPALVDRGALDACTDAMLAVDPVEVGDDAAWSCDGIGTLEAFRQAPAEARAHCALAVARGATADDTISDQLARFFAEETGPGGMSFEGFLQACADDANPLCKPSSTAGCGYQLVAFAAHDVHRTNLENDAARTDALLAELMAELGEMAGEVFVARQLGAFYNDIELRRQWLRNSAAPAVFLDAVESANQALMDEWEAKVLDVQRDVFRGFFTQDVLTFLGRPLNGEQANARRVSLLNDAATMWRGYAEGLMLAANRLNEVVRDTQARKAHARDLQQRALELYLVMGMINDFNRAAGASSHNAALASNFGQLSVAIARLGMSFDDTVFARDAEVVVARSLNPLSDNNSLLSERRDHALATVESARVAIEGILDEVTIEALSEAELRTRINNDRRNSANRIAELCGLPPGCTENDLLVRSECVRVEPGECGLLDAANPEIDASFDPARVAASEAGRAVLSVLEAYHNVAIQNDELAGFLRKLELQYEELEAFKRDVEDWNQKRLEGLEDLRRNLAQRDRIRDARVRDMLANFDDRARVRAEQVRAMDSRFDTWDELRRGQAQSNLRSKLEELTTHKRANVVEAAGAKTSTTLDAVAESLPRTAGASPDPFAKERATILFASNTIALTSSYKANDMRLMAEKQTITRELHQELFEATMAGLDEQAQIDDAIRDHEIAELEEAALVDAQLRDDELAQVQEALELMREQREAELAYSRDMADFRARRSDYLQQMVDISGRILRVEHSRFNVVQRFLEYDNVVQKARLEAARLQELDRQIIDLENLVGGIGAVFSRSYTLERAESHLDHARQALMDWLVVIEYYAVRPFIEQRIQILLARNAYQLEAIAQKLQQLENTCGGAERSKATATLSLRRQVLGLTRAQQGSDEKDVLSADERFRRWLAQSYVPVDRRIRFSTSESLSHVLDRTDGVLAATFTLGLSDFGNLNLACNAKVESVAIQLVGELGDLQPTATILYDGTSQLRSCQPNIAEYVRAFADGRTSYDTITQLRTAGRAMSPIAGINRFPDAAQAVNRSLAGLPVASEYTLLISTTGGDNGRLDWSKLEDVLIQVEYSYQDLFAEACD